MLRLVLLFCSLPLVGCGFLDDDLLLDDEAYEHSMHIQGHSHSSACGGGVYRRSVMRLGEMTIHGGRHYHHNSDYDYDYDEEVDEYRDEMTEMDFDDENIYGIVHVAPPAPKIIDPWLAAFIRLELNH